MMDRHITSAVEASTPDNHLSCCPSPGTSRGTAIPPSRARAGQLHERRQRAACVLTPPAITRILPLDVELTAQGGQHKRDVVLLRVAAGADPVEAQAGVLRLDQLAA